MGLCTNRACGCALTSTSMDITGNGSADNPYVLEVAADVEDRLDDLESAVVSLQAGNPACQVRMSTPQSIPNSAVTTALFDTEDFDPLAWHSTTVNTGRITPTLPGWYQVSWVIDWGEDADYNNRIMQVQKNSLVLSTCDVSWDFSNPISNQSFRTHAATPLISINGSTDYLNLLVFQSNVSLGANTINALFLVEWKRPL